MRTRHTPDYRASRLPFSDDRPAHWQHPEFYHHADPYTVKRLEELPGDLNAMKVGLVLGVIVSALIWAAPFVELWWMS